MVVSGKTDLGLSVRSRHHPSQVEYPGQAMLSRLGLFIELAKLAG